MGLITILIRIANHNIVSINKGINIPVYVLLRGVQGPPQASLFSTSLFKSWKNVKNITHLPSFSQRLLVLGPFFKSGLAPSLLEKWTLSVSIDQKPGWEPTTCREDTLSCRWPVWLSLCKWKNVTGLKCLEHWQGSPLCVFQSFITSDRKTVKIQICLRATHKNTASTW